MSSKPFGRLVAFHREEPVGAAASVLAASVLVAMASHWSHGLFESGHMHTSAQSAALTASIFVLWLIAAVVAVVYWVRRDSRSHTLPIVIAWLVIAMVQVGATAHVIDTTFMRSLFMAILSGIGYIVTTSRLHEKHMLNKREDRMIPFKPAAVPVVEVDGDERFVPTRK